jgi:hypothetical protein
VFNAVRQILAVVVLAGLILLAGFLTWNYFGLSHSAPQFGDKAEELRYLESLSNPSPAPRCRSVNKTGMTRYNRRVGILRAPDAG